VALVEPGWALLSVHDKTGIEDLARGLAGKGYRLIASGGTHRALVRSGIHSSTLEEVTRSPEMLGGRVKTLHPTVFGGILFRRRNGEDLERIRTSGIPAIDIVVKADLTGRHLHRR